VKTVLRACAVILPLWLFAACTPASLGVRPSTPPVADGPTPEARMSAAEERYRQALILLENGNPEGVPESDAALEDMEDALHACNHAPACAIAQLLVSYKRLLKLDGPDAEDAGVIEDEDAPAVPMDADAITDAATVLQPDDQKFREMVQITPAVQAGIRRWLTDMRASLITSHENYQSKKWCRRLSNCRQP